MSGTPWHFELWYGADATSDLRAALSGKGLSKESQDRLLRLHDDNAKLNEDIKILSSKLSKARAVGLCLPKWF
jgi:hypothetical protein